MRVLVSGASGFVGGHLLEHLAECGDSVAGLSSTGRWPEALRQLEDRATLQALDLVSTPEAEFVAVIQEVEPDAIIHLAAQANPQRSMADPRRDLGVEPRGHAEPAGIGEGVGPEASGVAGGLGG